MDKDRIDKNIELATSGKVSYVSGYAGRYSTITCRCNVHNKLFEAKYDTVIASKYNNFVSPCPICSDERRKARKKPLIKLTCDFCGKTYFKAYKRLTFNFCCRKCKDAAQSISSGDKFKELRPRHYGEGDSIYSYRTRALRKYGRKCAICGYDEDIDVLEVHHIDSNRNHNKLDNLIVLCPTCHKKLTTRKYELINRVKIVKK